MPAMIEANRRKEQGFQLFIKKNPKTFAKKLSHRKKLFAKKVLNKPGTCEIKQK